MESCHQRPYRDAMQTKEQPTNMSTQGTRVASSAGIIGAIIAALSCTACFPALAVLASALGLGFLSQFESVSIHYVLPLFALIGLAANLVGGRGRGWVRMVIGIAGPLLVLAAAMLMATYGIATEWLLYPGLVIMIGVAIWDLKATRSDPTPINADLPTMRRCLDRNDADRCLPVFL